MSFEVAARADDRSGRLAGGGSVGGVVSAGRFLLEESSSDLFAGAADGGVMPWPRPRRFSWISSVVMRAVARRFDTIVISDFSEKRCKERSSENSEK